MPLGKSGCAGGRGTRRRGRHRGCGCRPCAGARSCPGAEATPAGLHPQECAFLSHPPMTSTAFSLGSVCLTASQGGPVFPFPLSCPPAVPAPLFSHCLSLAPLPLRSARGTQPTERPDACAWTALSLGTTANRFALSPALEQAGCAVSLPRGSAVRG